MHLLPAPVSRRVRSLLPLVALTFGFLPAALAAGPTRLQEIPLAEGWNAIHLAVDPLERDPAAVFGGLPVDRVAARFDRPVTNQFVTDPSVDLTRGGDWAVWYAPDRPDAFLNSLDAVLGGPYLVHARAACRLKVRGEVRPLEVDWRPDAYNLVGFPVRTPGGPTFAEFFAGSEAHRDQPIYRLVDGRWKRLENPAGAAMRSGEAFWIRCDGGSDYQGPLRVEMETSNGLLLGSGAAPVVLRNAGPHPLSPTLHHLPAEGPPVPLSILVRGFGDPAAPVRAVPAEMPAGAWQQPLPALEIGGSVSIPFECRGGAMGRARQSSLLKITTDLGTECWLPVVGSRRDLGE